MSRPPVGAQPNSPIALSVLIRTLNEEDRLAKTLESALPLQAEIVVVDAGSTDRTVEIARSYGARVVTNPWEGFGQQRRFGEMQCSNNFVFSLDADEILTPEIVSEIRSLFLKDSPPSLIRLRKALVPPHWDRPPPLGYCHEYVLIYDRKIARTKPDPNWDTLEIDVKSAPYTIKSPLLHFSFRDINHMTTKAVQIARLAANTMPARSSGMMNLRLLVEFPLSFLKFYFVRRYCLAGLDGFVLAIVSAYGRFIRVAMMRERAILEKRKSV